MTPEEREEFVQFVMKQIRGQRQYELQPTFPWAGAALLFACMVAVACLGLIVYIVV